MSTFKFFFGIIICFLAMFKVARSHWSLKEWSSDCILLVLFEILRKQTELLKFWLSPSQKKINVCLSRILEFCLLSAICSGPTVTLAYVEAKNIYLKYRISFSIILMQPDFCFSSLFVWAEQKHCPMSEKKPIKMKGICVW